MQRFLIEVKADYTKVKLEVAQKAKVSDKYIGLQLGSIDPDTVLDKYVFEWNRLAFTSDMTKL